VSVSDYNPLLDEVNNIRITDLFANSGNTARQVFSYNQVVILDEDREAF